MMSSHRHPALLLLLLLLPLLGQGWLTALPPAAAPQQPPPRRARAEAVVLGAASASASSSAAAAAAGTSTAASPKGGGAASPVTVQQVFVCTNRWCMQRGAGATMGSFIGLTPYGSKIRVQGVDCLGRCNKGPNIRLLKSNGTFEELSYIDSVDKVYDVFTSQLGIAINQSSADCLKLNFQGNAHLDKNEVDQAIDCYDKAIPLSHKGQEGVLRVMRSTAYLQRAYTHFMQFRELVDQIAQPLPDQAVFRFLEMVQGTAPFLVVPILSRLTQAYEARGRLYRLTKFQFSLFEFAVHKACHDALTATHILPNFTKSWIRAGHGLRFLRRFKDAIACYEVVVKIDPSTAKELEQEIELLDKVQRYVENARDQGISEESLVITLDSLGVFACS